MVNVENRVAQIEQFLNPIDWIPCIASFSGMVRILAAGVQVAAGFAFAALKCFYVVMTGRGSYSRALEEGFNYSFHGLANITRGSIAMIPIFNMILFIYDKKVGRVNYEGEKMNPKVYPIMTAHRLVAQY